MARKTPPDAGIPPAPPIGGARTFAQMEDLARRHAAAEAAKSAPVPPRAPAENQAAPEPAEQEASTDE